MAEDGSSGTHRSPRRWWLIAAIGGVVGVQIVYGILIFELLGPRMDVRGQFGDLFGGVTALFTGLAFAGVIYTILLQRNELELQREELRLNREELHRSADAQLQQVQRLGEAAELGAISTLVTTYDTLLQPLRDATHETRVEIARRKHMLESTDMNVSQKGEVAVALTQLESEIRLQEREWSTIIQRHEELVERLETLVGQRAQDNGTAHKPE